MILWQQNKHSSFVLGSHLKTNLYSDLTWWPKSPPWLFFCKLVTAYYLYIRTKKRKIISASLALLRGFPPASFLGNSKTSVRTWSTLWIWCLWIRPSRVRRLVKHGKFVWTVKLGSLNLNWSNNLEKVTVKNWEGENHRYYGYVLETTWFLVFLLPTTAEIDFVHASVAFFLGGLTGHPGRMVSREGNIWPNTKVVSVETRNTAVCNWSFSISMTEPSPSEVMVAPIAIWWFKITSVGGNCGPIAAATAMESTWPVAKWICPQIQQQQSNVSPIFEARFFPEHL